MSTNDTEMICNILNLIGMVTEKVITRIETPDPTRNSTK